MSLVKLVSVKLIKYVRILVSDTSHAAIQLDPAGRYMVQPTVKHEIQ